MSVLIEVKEGLFINPAFISSVVTTASYACMFVARGNSDEAIHLDLAQWLAVKPLLVARYAARPDVTDIASRESVTAKAVSEILEEEAVSLDLFQAVNNALSSDTPDDFMAEVRRLAESAVDPTEPVATFSGIVSTIPPTDGYPPDPVRDTDLSRLIQVVQSGNFVILDTETTGLNGDAEICQIAIIDAQGNTLLDTLVKPQKPIPSDATRIHGITNDMVKDAPSWIDVRFRVLEAITGKTVVVYNAVYDRKIMHQCDEFIGLPRTDYKDWAAWECAMLAYAEYRGVWNDYHGNYKWHKLVDAAARVGYSLPAGMKAHSALADCLMTLAVCRKLAGL